MTVLGDRSKQNRPQHSSNNQVQREDAMSEEIYENPQLTKKSDNTDVRNGHNDASIYVNCRPTKFISSKPENQATEQHLRRRNLVRAAAVFLVLLCLGLLTAVIVLGIENKEVNQLRSDIVKLTSEREELYSKLTIINHNLTELNSLLKDEKEFLKTINRNLTTERDELKTQIEATRCPSSWIKFQNSCYLISTTLKSWTDSRNICEDHGADLVIISTIMENAFLSSFNQRIWIGLTKQTENSWKWINGEAATTTYWKEGEPNNAGPGDENCVDIINNFPLINNWNDRPCNDSLKFICEKALQ